MCFLPRQTDGIALKTARVSLKNKPAFLETVPTWVWNQFPVTKPFRHQKVNLSSLVLSQWMFSWSFYLLIPGSDLSWCPCFLPKLIALWVHELAYPTPVTESFCTLVSWPVKWERSLFWAHQSVIRFVAWWEEPGGLQSTESQRVRGEDKRLGTHARSWPTQHATLQVQEHSPFWGARDPSLSYSPWGQLLSPLSPLAEFLGAPVALQNRCVLKACKLIFCKANRISRTEGAFYFKECPWWILSESSRFLRGEGSYLSTYLFSFLFKNKSR